MLNRATVLISFFINVSWFDFKLVTFSFFDEIAPFLWLAIDSYSKIFEKHLNPVMLVFIG